MDDESLLPGASPTRPERSSGPPFTLVVLAALVVAAVIGLLAGAVWGLSGQNAATPGPVLPPASDSTGGTASTPAAPTPSVPPPTPGPTTPAPTPTLPNGFPPAPQGNQQTSNDWHVGKWRITNTAGVIGMVTTLTNRAPTTRSGSFTMYLYINGAPLATLTAAASDVAAGVAQELTFVSTDRWGPGSKTLLFVASP